MLEGGDGRAMGAGWGTWGVGVGGGEVMTGRG